MEHILEGSAPFWILQFLQGMIQLRYPLNEEDLLTPESMSAIKELMIGSLETSRIFKLFGVSLSCSMLLISSILTIKGINLSMTTSLKMI